MRSTIPCWLHATKNRSIFYKSFFSLLVRGVSSAAPNTRVKPAPLYLVTPRDVDHFWSKKNTSLEAKKHEELGITEFLSPHDNWLMARVKEENSDFQVHEIDLHGRIIQLTDTTRLPEELKPIIDESERRQEDDPQGNRKPFKKVFIHCTMYKEGVDHHGAAKIIAESLEISPNQIDFAGRKDKVGQTTQRMSISTDNIAQWSVDHTKVCVGNFSYELRSIETGELYGNHFKILLRDVQLYDEHNKGKQRGTKNSSLAKVAVEEATAAMTTAVKRLRRNGFINYFGIQRFAYNGHKAGGAVLQKNWQKAIDLLLAPRPNEASIMADAKKIWLRERNPNKIMRFLGRKHFSTADDRIILLGLLADHYTGTNESLEVVYQSLPKYIRSLHHNAFMSYLWNRIASLRHQKFGLTILPGDFVYVDPPTLRKKKSSLSEQDEVKQVEEDDPRSKRRTNVRMLTKEDLVDGHSYTIYDALIPILGTQLPRYACPELQELCEQVLTEEEVPTDVIETLGDVDIQHGKGSYRPFVVRPDDLECKTIPYGSRHDLSVFMPSDLQLLRNEANLDAELGGGLKDKLCAIVSFKVPSSCFATMALREIIKTSNFCPP